MAVNKSLVFKAYNIAKKRVAEGSLDRVLLNRALGIVQLREPRPYASGIHYCTCPDCYFRKRACKHRYARLLERIMKELT